MNATLRGGIEQIKNKYEEQGLIGRKTEKNENN